MKHNVSIGNYEELASSVIVQAIQDYRKMRQKKREGKWEVSSEKVNAKKKVYERDLIQFFHGEWITALLSLSTDADFSYTGESIYNILKEEQDKEDELLMEEEDERSAVL